MDNRLIFLCLVLVVISWGVTRDEGTSVEMTQRLIRKTVAIGKSVAMTLSGDEKSEAKVEDNWFKLNSPRKTSQ